MRKIISIASVIGAGILAVGFVENDMLAASLPMIGWMFFWLAAQKKKPRAATRSKRTLDERHLYLYHIADEARFQDEIRLLKAWEDAI